MGISFKFTKQVGPNLKQVGLLLVKFQKIVPNKRVGWKICYSLEWKKCKNDNRVYSFIWHPRVREYWIFYSFLKAGIFSKYILVFVIIINTIIHFEKKLPFNDFFWKFYSLKNFWKDSKSFTLNHFTSKYIRCHKFGLLL